MDARFQYNRHKPTPAVQQQETRKERQTVLNGRQLAYGLAIPSIMVSGPLGGWLLGSWLDEQFGTKFVMILLILVGVAGSFWTRDRHAHQAKQHKNLNRPPRPFIEQVTLDFLVLGIAGGLLALVWWPESVAAGFICACLWMALNTVLLARLLEAVTLGGPSGTGIGLLLICAKIPLSYAILFWLYQTTYLDKLGLTAGVLSLPVILLARGIAMRRRQHNEEGNG